RPPPESLVGTDAAVKASAIIAALAFASVHLSLLAAFNRHRFESFRSMPMELELVPCDLCGRDSYRVRYCKPDTWLRQGLYQSASLWPRLRQSPPHFDTDGDALPRRLPRGHPVRSRGT